MTVKGAELPARSETIEIGEVVRKAMADRDCQYTLAGLVEIDESFFGSSFSGKRGRGTEKKELVIVAVSIWKDKIGKERPGLAQAFEAENADAETIENILKRLDVSAEEIEPLITAIRSDGWRNYQTVTKKLGIVHNRAVLRDPKDSMKLLPWTHKIIANAIVIFAGPHRGVSKKHLQSYLSEVCYRFILGFVDGKHFIAYCLLALQKTL